MGDLIHTLLIASLTVLCVMALKLIPPFRSRPAGYAFGLVVCSAAYLLAWYFHDVEIIQVQRLLLYGLIVAQPVFFWLMACDLFDDRFRVRWWHGLIIAGKFLLAGALAAGKKMPDMFAPFSIDQLPRLLPNFFYTLGFVFHALIVILRTDRSDLVEPRRRLRRLVLGFTGLMILGAILTAAVLRPIGLGDQADITTLTAITAALVATLAWGDGAWRELFADQVKSAPVPGDADPAIMQQAVAAMEVDELFRTEGLTVTALAEKLRVQEYRLRRAINGGLGYRNFNEYLNFYRMRAAKKFLSAPENSDYPLIHLALDLGYPSPAPFNRAFKEATGMAPGEYKKRSSAKVN